MATQVPFDFVRDWRGDVNIGKQCEVLIEDRNGSGYPLHFLWDAASEALSHHRWDSLENVFYEGLIAEICSAECPKTPDSKRKSVDSEPETPTWFTPADADCDGEKFPVPFDADSIDLVDTENMDINQALPDPKTPIRTALNI
ncbi:hypothetical protein AB5N19_02483 [Seiridium cardinale]